MLAVLNEDQFAVWPACHLTLNAVDLDDPFVGAKEGSARQVRRGQARQGHRFGQGFAEPSG